MGLRDRLNKKPEPPTGSFSVATPTRQMLTMPGGDRGLVPRAQARAAPEADREARPADDREAAPRAAARRAAPDPEPDPRDQRPAAQPRRARAAGRGAAGRGDGPRAARAAAARHDHLRHHGQHLQHGLHRAVRQAGADRRPLPRQRPPAADHQPHRVAGRPPDRRVVADGRRPPARRLPRQRDHPAPGHRRPDPVDPPLRRQAAADQGHDRDQQRHARDAGVPRGLCEGQASTA